MAGTVTVWPWSERSAWEATSWPEASRTVSKATSERPPSWVVSTSKACSVVPILVPGTKSVEAVATVPPSVPSSFTRWSSPSRV